MVILFQDECHLLWGDVCGYVWGPRNARVEVPMTNERERQTCYGAVNLATGQCLVHPTPVKVTTCTSRLTVKWAFQPLAKLLFFKKIIIF
jgi:hypothetical protein